MQYQIPKGLFDILPYQDKKSWQISYVWQQLEEVIRKLTQDYNFSEIRTPIFEKTDLFVRGVGESSDIASKEMYTFLDKAERSLSLRPEGTAAVMRSFIENNLTHLRKIHKLYYIGPMFRYDRPQKGRYRQHHQFGVEIIGDDSYKRDFEAIDLALELFNRLNIKNITLLINSVGDQKTRLEYKKALKNFLSPHLKDLSSDSQIRFEKNILRILDSKDPKDKEIVKDAPKILDFLSNDAKEHFENVLKLLKSFNISYKIDDNLVRGLDYYDNTVFEIVTDELGSQNSLGGGGRYNTLLKELKGPDLPGVGVAFGLERILQTLFQQNSFDFKPNSCFVFFIPLDKKSEDLCFDYLTKLRHLKIPCEIDLNVKKIQKSLQTANLLNSQNCIIIGEDEINKKTATIKNLKTKTQESIPLNNLIDHINRSYLG